MTIEVNNREILIRFEPADQDSKIQNIIDYLRYEELTSKSNAGEEDVTALLKMVKKGRWERTKKELGIND